MPERTANGSRCDLARGTTRKSYQTGCTCRLHDAAHAHAALTPHFTHTPSLRNRDCDDVGQGVHRGSNDVNTGGNRDDLATWCRSGDRVPNRNSVMREDGATQRRAPWPGMHPDRAVMVFWPLRKNSREETTVASGPPAVPGDGIGVDGARGGLVPAGARSCQTPGQPSPRLVCTGWSVATGGRLWTAGPLETRKSCWRGARAAESESLLMT
jgi:hypothetical protein